jgi:hypothetical protein
LKKRERKRESEKRKKTDGENLHPKPENSIIAPPTFGSLNI